MFKNVTDFFGIYKSHNDFDKKANERMIFTKEDDGVISKKIRYDEESGTWKAANEAPGTNPKPFWHSTRGDDQCLAKSGEQNLQTW